MEYSLVDSSNLFFYSGYQDDLFYSFPHGYYAYAVRIMEIDSAITGWYYTNTISKFPEAIEDQNQDLNQILVFPNPAKKVLKITSDKTMVSARLMNALGQTVIVKLTDEEEITLQTGFLKSGFYFLQVQTEDEYAVRKVLINQ